MIRTGEESRERRKLAAHHIVARGATDMRNSFDTLEAEGAPCGTRPRATLVGVVPTTVSVKKRRFDASTQVDRYIDVL